MAELLSHPWWLLLFAGFGVLSLSTLVLNLFSSIGDRPGHAEMSAECDVGSREFLVGLSGMINAPLQAGGEARMLNNGDEFLPAILDAFAAAEHSINVMLYIWEEGRMSDRFFDALIRRASDGIEVRVMVDGFGGIKAPEEKIEELRRAGGSWRFFHPVRFGMLTRIHKRNHRRAIVIDGRVGFTGGAAVMDKWLGNARTPEEWRDCMIEVRGRIATSLQGAFAQLWAQVTGEMLIGSRYFPTPEQAEETLPAGGEPLFQHINVISSPSTETHPMRLLFWLSFRAARQRIYITNPYFVPDDTMASVLMDRARSGIDVRVLVPNEHNDVPIIRWASRGNYEPLLESGVRIYEFQPTMIHQKTAVVDGKWSLVGSANLDVRSKELNQENALAILDRGFARQIEDAFQADLERAEEVVLEGFRRRPVWHRVPERILGLFEEQF